MKFPFGNWKMEFSEFPALKFWIRTKSVKGAFTFDVIFFLN